MAVNKIRCILYDANCIIYHCFFATERYKKKTIQFKYPLFSEKIQNLTNFFCKEDIKIITISDIWKEIFNKGIATIVEEVIREYYVHYYKIFKRRKFPPLLKLKLNKKLERKISGLKEKEWFNLIQYNPSNEDVADIAGFYLSQKKTKTMEKIRKTKGIYGEILPSRADLNLLKYSQINKIPLLTNDMDIVRFRKDLEKRKLCYKIYPLLETEIEKLEENFNR